MNPESSICWAAVIVALIIEAILFAIAYWIGHTKAEIDNERSLRRSPKQK